MIRTADEMIRAGIVEQACGWQARMSSDDLSAAEKVQFLNWLRDNPHNVQEYLSIARMSRLMPAALAGPTVASKHSVPESSTALSASAIPQFRHILRWAAVFLIAVGGIYGGVQLLGSDGSMSVKVAHGDQRTVHLEDGSIIHLNSQSKAKIRYSSHERSVELERGQGLFTVAKDATRPFRVRAGNIEVVAIGTAFDVYRRSGRDVVVTVIDGKVDVLNRKNRAAPKPYRLGAGQQVQVAPVPSASAVATVDVSTAIAWTRREIVFTGRPLVEVTEEFNRYLGRPVRIDDDVLAQTRVSGIFSAYDEAGFVAFLREFPGMEVVVSSDSIRVRSVNGRIKAAEH